MKYVIFVLAFLVSFAVSADPQVDIAEHHCHFPKDSANTDNEDKLYCEGRLVNNSRGQTVAGYAIVKQKVPQNFVPPKTKAYGDGTNAQCRVTNDDAGKTLFDEWESTVKGSCKRGTNGKLTCIATHEIICGNPDDAYLE